MCLFINQEGRAKMIFNAKLGKMMTVICYLNSKLQGR